MKKPRKSSTCRTHKRVKQKANKAKHYTQINGKWVKWEDNVGTIMKRAPNGYGKRNRPKMKDCHGRPIKRKKAA